MKKTQLWKIALLIAVFSFIIFSRFAFLGEKPYHHDESQYASFSYYNYTGSMYKYDPVLHGPFLFYVNTVIYKIFGAGDFTARMGVAVFGVLVAVVFLLMAKWTGFWTSFILIVSYAISPSFTYFNRFLAHDTYVAFFSVLLIYFFTGHIKTLKPKYIYFSSVTLAFLFTIKISSYIYSFIYFTFLMLILIIPAPEKFKEQRKDYLLTLKNQILHIFIAVIIFFAINLIFYSSFFYNIQGFFDGLFLESFRYWIGQNAVQRIKGDFDYHFPILAVYELPILAITFVSLFANIFSNKKSALKFILVSLVSLLIFILLRDYLGLMLFKPDMTLKKFFDLKLHMQSPYHLPMALLIFYAGAYSTYLYLKNEKYVLGFITYWLTLSLLIYSYAGEKVPWLVLNILMPMLFYSSYVMYDFFRSKIFRKDFFLFYPLCGALATALIFTIIINYRVTIKYPADPAERLVFVQTSTDIANLVKKIEAIAEKTGEGKNLKIAIHGDAGWPMNWYLRNYKSCFPPPPIEDSDNKIIVMDHQDGEKRVDLKAKFNSERLILRTWWVPNMNKKIGIKKILKYYFLRRPWSAIGTYDIDVFIKKGLE